MYQSWRLFAWQPSPIQVHNRIVGVSVWLTRTPAAIEACTSIIFLDPTNDGAFVNRGIAYRRIGDLELALRDYDEAIRLNPNAADAFNNRGNAYRALNEFDKAIRDYDEAIRLNPQYAHAYNNRGVIFLEVGEPGRAAADFDEAIERDRRLRECVSQSRAGADRSALVRSRHQRLRRGVQAESAKSGTAANTRWPCLAAASRARGKVTRAASGHTGGQAAAARRGRRDGRRRRQMSALVNARTMTFS